MPPAEQRRRCSYRSLEVSSVFWVDPSVLVLFGRPCCLKNCDCDRHDFFKAPPPGYAVLWSVGVGAAGAPVSTRSGSRFIASVMVVGKAQTGDGLPRGRWPCAPRITDAFVVIHFSTNQKRIQFDYGKIESIRFKSFTGVHSLKRAKAAQNTNSDLFSSDWSRNP